jgi:sugar-specific transcriptional regulator TrmB
MARYKLVDGNTVQLTSEEEAQRDAEEAQAAIDKQAREDAKSALNTNKASGKAKLKAGEALNDAELSALFGD